MKILICGFGSAGYSALMTLKRIDPKAEIIVVDPKEKELMHPCGLPYALEGLVRIDDITQEINLQRMGVTRIKGKCEKIIPDEKIINTATASGIEQISYDRLLIATGYKPFKPRIEGLEKHMNKSVFTLAGKNDLDNILSRLDSVDKCAVIGAGAIGLEAAFAFREHGKEVTVIEMQNQILPGTLDPDMSAIAEDYILSAGIKLLKGTPAGSFNGDNKLTGVSCDACDIEADLAILAAGFGANTDIIRDSGIEISAEGIKVNSCLETGCTDIFAAGDCIAGWWIIDKSPTRSKLATSAYRQGAVAAMNIMDRRTEYHGTAGTFVTKIGNLEIAGTGFNTQTATDKGYKAAAGKITSHILPDYFPGNTQVTIKVIFDSITGKILGAQGIGERGAAERINIISTAIEFDIPIDQIGRTEMAYCPAVSEVYDPLMRAVDFGLRRMKK